MRCGRAGAGTKHRCGHWRCGLPDAPDGYTLELSTNTTHAANASLYKKLPYDPIKDFEHIGIFRASQ